MKQYTKKQITEAIAYWEGVLKQMNEATEKKFYIQYAQGDSESDMTLRAKDEADARKKFEKIKDDLRFDADPDDPDSRRGVELIYIEEIKGNKKMNEGKQINESSDKVAQVIQPDNWSDLTIRIAGPKDQVADFEKFIQDGSNAITTLINLDRDRLNDDDDYKDDIGYQSTILDDDYGKHNLLDVLDGYVYDYSYSRGDRLAWNEIDIENELKDNEDFMEEDIPAATDGIRFALSED